MGSKKFSRILNPSFQFQLHKAYFDAIRTHKQRKLKLILTCYPSLIKVKNPLGLNGLMQAVASRNYDAITYLLYKDIDPNVMDVDGWTAKAWAVLLNDFESMKRLRGVSALSHSVYNDLSGLAIVAVGSFSRTV